MAAKNFWTDENQALLEKMWKNGMSARDIAEALGGGVTRNAVIGKANRMGLSQQPKKAEFKEPELLTAPSLKQCQWPFGDPNDADFHFCGKPVVPDWPYCQEHCGEAYRTLNDKDEAPAPNAESGSDAAKPEANATGAKKSTS